MTDLLLTAQGEAEAVRLGENYGAYEGRTSADIRAERSDWQLFRDGCPKGESPDQVGARADRVIRRVRAIEGDMLFFSSGHFLRMFAARWFGLDPGAGQVLSAWNGQSQRRGIRT